MCRCLFNGQIKTWNNADFFALLTDANVVSKSVFLNCSIFSSSCYISTWFHSGFLLIVLPMASHALWISHISATCLLPSLQCSLKVLTAFSAKAQTKAQKRCLCLQYFSLEWLFAEHLNLKKDFPFQFILSNHRLYFKTKNATK